MGLVVAVVSTAECGGFGMGKEERGRGKCD